MEVGLVLLLDVAVCVCVLGRGGRGGSSSLKTSAPVLLSISKKVSGIRTNAFS